MENPHEIAAQEPINTQLVRIDEHGDVALVHGGRPRSEVRKDIIALTKHLLAQPGEHKELHVEHETADGMYLRKLFIPKNTFLVGQIHLKPCHNIVAMGDISVLTEFGSRRLKAGFTGVSPVGIQKVGFAHEDTIFINVFRTDEVDINKIEAEVATIEFDALTCDEGEQECLSHG